jgi:hypothetical protein
MERVGVEAENKKMYKPEEGWRGRGKYLMFLWLKWK